MPPDIEDIYPLTPLQQGILAHSLKSAAGLYVQQLHCRISDRLNLDALKRAWREALTRHAVLRTSFVWEDVPQPVQVVLREVELPFDLLDWTSLHQRECATRLSNLLITERQTKFDFGRAPLMRVTLIRESESDYHLVWTYHHLLLDGWSTAALLAELFHCYENILNGGTSAARIARPFKEYVAYLQQRPATEIKEFWQKELEGFSQPTLLTQRNDPPSEEGLHEEQSLTISSEETTRLQEFCRSYSITLNTLAQAAWALLLARYTGNSDIVFGTVLSGRPAELVGADEGIGLYIQTVPFRAEVPMQETVLSWLRRLHAKQAMLLQNQWISLADVQALSEVAPPQPLFQTLLVFENYPIQAAVSSLRERHGIGELHFAENTHYPLALLVVPGDQLALRALFLRNKFEDRVVGRILKHFCLLLKQLSEKPNDCLVDISLLTVNDREQLQRWNAATTRTNQLRGGVQHGFERQAEMTPEGIALIADGQEISYRLLHAWAHSASLQLRAADIRPGSIVGLGIPRSLDAIVAILGILKSGAAYLPLDLAYPEQRLAFMLQDAGVESILTNKTCAGLIGHLSSELILLGETQQTEKPVDDLHTQFSSDRLAYVLYTSGSTGLPKGVAMSHRALLNLLEWHAREFPINLGFRCLQSAPLSFDVSFQEIFTTLCSGGTLVMPGEKARRDPDVLWHLIHAQRVERLFIPFVMLQQLAAAAAHSELVASDLKEIITAGERLQITPAIRTLFEKLPQCRLVNQYGPTETHVVTSFSLTGPVKHWPNLPPIGRPIDNTQIHILDSQQNPVPVSMIGELYVGGACLANGYLGHDELTRERFVHLRGEHFAGRVYRTGDLAFFREDGNIEFVGRKDEQVKVRGYRVELEEVEAQIGSYPGIRECAVVADRAVEGTRLIGCFTSAADIDIEELRGHLSSHLPEYMVPSLLLALAALPLTTSGKVDRRRVLQLARTQLEEGGTLTPPPQISTNVLQEIVAQTWAEVLQLPRIGLDDNFFSLGGHSLLAMQVISRLRAAFQIPITIQSIFDSPTVRQLAEQILKLREGESQKRVEISRRPSTRNPSPSFSQERMWFFDQLSPGTADYNIALRMRVLGHFDLAIAEKALNEIIRRHEILRTRYATAGGKPICRIVDEARLEIDVIDLESSLQQKSEIEEHARTEARRSFDLEKDLPLRVVALRMRQQELVLLLTLHHIAFDGWSLGLLAREFSDLFSAYCHGQHSPLAELTLQYSDFAAWQQSVVHGDFENKEVEFWRSTLVGAPPELALPLDHPRAPVLTNTSSGHRFSLDAKLSQRLRQFSSQASVTPFMTLLAAFYALLHRYTEQETIVIGTPLANRHYLETESLIGCFINPLPLRCDLSLDASFFDLVTRVRDMALGAYAHQDLPFERIVQKLAPERDLSRTPLFQVMFVFQNFAMKLPGIAGVSFQAESVETHNAIFDLTLTMWESEGMLSGLMEYNSSLFDADTIESLVEHYRNLLDSALAKPEHAIGDLCMLSEAGRQRVLTAWNQTECEVAEACVHQLFERQANATPNAVAIVCDTETLTYSDLHRRSDQIANYLRFRGVGSEKVVALCLERSFDAIAGMLGILKAGGAFLPVDPRLPRARLEFLLDDAAVSMVLTQSVFAPSVNERFQALCLDRDWQIIEDTVRSHSNRQVSLQDLCYVLYTSGSTGTPKGVMIEHGSLANYVQAACELYQIGSSDRILQFAPLWFDASLEEIFPALSRGATIVLRENGPPQPIPQFVSRCETSGITVLSLPTAYWREWAAQIGELPARMPDSLRLVILGGEKTNAEDVIAWRTRAPDSIRLLNTYGPTETTIIATAVEIEVKSPGDTVPIGRPIANTRAYVLDERLNPLPIGARGELYIGGRGVARGYLRQAELTAKHFVRDPFNSLHKDRLYRTGDIVRYGKDGNLEFIGRSDSQVKLRGHRIELAEIECALQQHPNVSQAVAMVHEERLRAYVVLGNAAPAPESSLGEFLRSRLPAYMIPEINVLSALPRIASGKVDRAALAAFAGSPRQRRSQAPGSDLEESLCLTWKELLKIRDVGIDDNFFELGGHSMLALQLVAQIRREFQVDVPIRTIFEQPTVAALAREIQHQRAGSPPLSAPTIDFENEARLDPEIQPVPAGERPDEIKKVFLTGATGFLGTFLLAEILNQTNAEVHCLVRSSNTTDPAARIHDCLRNFSRWHEEFAGRIVAVPGDLEKPRFALRDEEFLRLAMDMNCVYHNGAMVNAALPYHKLKSSNVGSTEEAIRLASLGKRKPLHLISTLSIFFTDPRLPQTVEEDTLVSSNHPPLGGYGQSKWIAERLVEIARSRGLECTVFRPGRIVGNSQSGRGRTDDVLGELLHACLQIGSVPEMEFLVDMVPVDYVAKAIIYISRQPDSAGKAFHLNHPQPVAWSAVVKMLPAVGLAMEVVPPGIWGERLQQLVESNRRFARLSTFLEGGWPSTAPSNHAVPNGTCTNTLQALAGSGIQCPKLDSDLLRRYLAHYALGSSTEQTSAAIACAVPK